jgi:hypothetical protein
MRGRARARWRNAAPSVVIAVSMTLACGLWAQGTQTAQPGAESPRPVEARAKKLILKNGTYQVATNYQIQGDRVRYYSVDRSQWEEIPTSLVDWDATHKAEAADAQKNQEVLAKIRAAEAAEKAEPIDVDASIEVAQGVFLPPGEGLYVVDGRSVLQLQQSEAGSKRDKGRVLKQVLVPIPIVPSRQNVEIPGRQAKFRITNSQPEFYMRTADAREPQMELIRPQAHGNARRVESLDVLFKQQAAKRNTLPLQRWRVARGVYRLTLGEPLQPGEYVLAEIVPDEGMNLFLWDFGVDTTAAKASGKPN